MLKELISGVGAELRETNKGWHPGANKDRGSLPLVGLKGHGGRTVPGAKEELVATGEVLEKGQGTSLEKSARQVPPWPGDYILPPLSPPFTPPVFPIRRTHWEPESQSRMERSREWNWRASAE